MGAERRIGDAVYRVEKLSAEEGLNLLLRVNNAFGGDGAILASLSTVTTRDTALKTFLAASMRNEIDPATVQGLLKSMVETCRVNGDPAIMGHKPFSMEDSIEVAWFAMEVQLRDFLSASVASPGK